MVNGQEQTPFVSRDRHLRRMERWRQLGFDLVGYATAQPYSVDWDGYITS
jgi:hypothetical protein